MAAYDAATFDRNRGIQDPSRRVCSGRTMARREVLSLYPGLPTTGLTGAGVFQDGQLLNPPRLVWAFVRSAGKLGCAACNYVEATGLVVDGGRAVGVRARDRVGGGDLTIRGRAVLNAAGPYAESFLKSAGLLLEPPTPWSRDAYFVVARALVAGDAALALPAKTRDPDTLVSRGAGACSWSRGVVARWSAYGTGSTGGSPMRSSWRRPRWNRFSRRSTRRTGIWTSTWTTSRRATRDSSRSAKTIRPRRISSSATARASSITCGPTGWRGCSR